MHRFCPNCGSSLFIDPAEGVSEEQFKGLRVVNVCVVFFPPLFFFFLGRGGGARVDGERGRGIVVDYADLATGTDVHGC